MSAVRSTPKSTSVGLPPSLYLRLQAHAEQVDRSLGWVIKDALDEYLSRREGDPDPGPSRKVERSKT